MSWEIKNRIGQKFNRLIVIKLAYQDCNGQAHWLCKCDCDKEVIVIGNSLRINKTQSCGCLHREKSSKRMKKLVENQIGKNHPAYINGKYCGKRTKETLKIKEKIRKRDNHVCQNCSLTQKEHTKKYNRVLEVHHIDGDDTNNDPENMITLCVGCHRKIKR